MDILQVALCIKLYEVQISLGWQESDKCFPREEVDRWVEAGYKDAQGTFGFNEYIHYLNGGDGLMDAYKWQSIKFYTLNMCSLLYTNYI